MSGPDPRARLLDLAAERRVSLAQLSGLIGRNPAYLQQFVRKGSPRRLEEGDRATLARFFGVGEAELGGSEEKSSDIAWADVPRLALGASAGPGALAADERPVGALRFSRVWLRRQGLDPARLSAIAVEGDSMEPSLRDGDEILVDAGRKPLRDGVYVVRVAGVLLVKRLETGRPGLVVLKSDNPVYDPIELAPAEVEVIGRVVWKGGRL
jgi:phage repressor protein C with HTH and peptisase S24 domain